MSAVLASMLVTGSVFFGSVAWLNLRARHGGAALPPAPTRPRRFAPVRRSRRAARNRFFA